MPVVNDAQAAAWAEYHALFVDADEMVFITISTGVGGGIICNGRLLSGNEGLAGHIGHTLADPARSALRRGRTGCVEAIASGRGIAALATDDLQGMTAKSIFALAQSGHPQATSLVHRSAQTIARLIADMKASVNCQCAVPGGSIGLAPGYPPAGWRFIGGGEPAVYHTKIVAVIVHQHACRPLIGVVVSGGQSIMIIGDIHHPECAGLSPLFCLRP